MTDILVDSLNDFELMFENGDFKLGDPSEQNVNLLFVTSPGEWKEIPEVGIGIGKQKGLVIDRFFKRTCRLQLEADGFDIEFLNITTQGVQVDGVYSTG